MHLGKITRYTVDSTTKALTAELIIKDQSTQELHVLRASRQIIATIFNDIPIPADLDNIQQLLLMTEHTLHLKYSDATITSRNNTK